MNEHESITEEAPTFDIEAATFGAVWTAERFREICAAIRFDPNDNDALIKQCYQSLDGLDACGYAALAAWETGQDIEVLFLEELRGCYHDARAYVATLTAWLDRVEPMVPLVDQLGYTPPPPDDAAIASRAAHRPMLPSPDETTTAPPEPSPPEWTSEEWRGWLTPVDDNHVREVDLRAMEGLQFTYWGLLERWEDGTYTPECLDELRLALAVSIESVGRVLVTNGRAIRFLNEAERRGVDGPPLDEAALQAQATAAQEDAIVSERVIGSTWTPGAVSTYEPSPEEDELARRVSTLSMASMVLTDLVSSGVPDWVLDVISEAAEQNTPRRIAVVILSAALGVPTEDGPTLSQFFAMPLDEAVELRQLVRSVCEAAAGTLDAEGLRDRLSA